MSPEQALGGENMDGRADIYALGITLFEMLEGTPPFQGNTPQAILAQTFSGQHKKLTRDPLTLQRVLDRSIAREPEQRFATGAELAAALDASITGGRVAGGGVFGSRRGILVAAVAGAVVLAGVALWSGGYRADGDPRKSLIIFPFENKTGEPSRDYLKEASMNLIGLAAAHWADMRVFDDERTASLLRRREIPEGSTIDFEAARSMAREARVGTLVLGDIRREGDSLAIEAKVHDVRSGDRLETRIVRGPLNGDPRLLFDNLAKQLLGIAGAPTRERPTLLAQTTSSLEAYRSYLAGTAALQRFAIDSARTLFQRAVTLDSSFALAYIRLRDVEGWSGGGSGDRETKRRYVLAAERHGAALPPRVRSLVEFHRAYEDGDYRRARRVASALIAKDSTDVEAWYQLGEAHYHDGSMNFPHPDSAGNVGIALRVFQRTLALDSTYMLAYQHILDALRACANPAPWVCLADSAVYAAPEELTRRLGEAKLKAYRDAARTAQIETARGWITAAPTAARARGAMIQLLFDEKRYDEAFREADAMARLGAPGQAGFWKASILFHQGKPGEASFVFDSALKTARDTLPQFIGFNNVPGLVSLFPGGGGRLDAGRRYNRAIFRLAPFDSASGPGNIRMSKAELERFTIGYALADAGLPEGAAESRELFRLVTRRAGRDTVALKRVTTTMGAASLGAFLITRDTSFLTQFLPRADTIESSTWRVADAQLALERRDTARARMRVERHYRTPGVNEFSGEQGIIRAFAWGDLLGRLGEPRLAIEAFARLDSSDSRAMHPGYLVRSYAERGAMYQQLREDDRAVEYYERFIAAWKDSDAALRPQVNQALRRVQELRDRAPGMTVRP
jgi:tetratricopeptide (TPR) repeat protein/TolB-like protein